jgi:glucose/mannose-6-phosphate isomerase
LIAELISGNCVVPVLVNKDYQLPGFTNENTLVIISSYSGNTEETLSCLEQAIKQKAQIICITSGGKVAEIAKEHNYDLILVPRGNPPRTCLGYSLVQLFAILKFNKLISTDYQTEFHQSSELINALTNDIKTEAKEIAIKLIHQTPIIYSLGTTESIAVRFRQQLNENSKILCWHHVIPEMNHNELVGWTEKNENLSVIVLKTDFDHPKNRKRLEICIDIFKKYTSHLIEINAKGNSKIEQAIYLINLTDWVSYYIAEIKNIDAVEVRVIDFLKNELAKA